LMIICKSGMTIRTAIDKLRIMGRATQGVRLINLKEKDSIAGLAKTPREEEEEEIVTDVDIVVDETTENNQSENTNETNE